jgi:hypothetical protein
MKLFKLFENLFAKPRQYSLTADEWVLHRVNNFVKLAPPSRKAQAAFMMRDNARLETERGYHKLYTVRLKPHEYQALQENA